MAKRNRSKWEKILRYEFIVDFYCPKLCLAIEIDGGYHNEKLKTDELRDKFLNQIGIKTIRFTNDEVS